MTVPERPVLVAPDKFKGTFNAAQVAGAIGRGLEKAGLMPPDLCPVADGGDGTLDALLPVFDRNEVAIIFDGDEFVGLITRIDLINHLRRAR